MIGPDVRLHDDGLGWLKPVTSVRAAGNSCHDEKGQFCETSTGSGGPAHPQEELDALRAYSDGGQGSFGPGGFEAVNQHLRFNSTVSDSTKTAISRLDSAFDRVELTSSHVQLYRGVSHQFAGQLKKQKAGAIFRDNGFVSTSRTADTADKFGGGKSGATMTIKTFPGSKMIDMNKTLGDKVWKESEKEVLLPRGSLFKITKVVKKREGGLHFTVELQ